MKIQLLNAGKRYNRDRIFRNLNYHFETGNSYAITGPNGSGKSTLLQIISGALSLNEGSITWRGDAGIIPAENIYLKISLCAPYLDLVEEFTLAELLRFHQSFKPFISGFSSADVMDEVQLSHAAQKKISDYSSGMKQRAKLAQCIFSSTPVVLLDEPCTNLDEQGIALYHRLIEKYCQNRLVIVSSNDTSEYNFCNQVLNISDFK